MFKNKFIITGLIFILYFIQTSYSQFCEEMEGKCTNENCLNDICYACDNGNDVANGCHCPAGQYNDADDNNTCKPCDPSCVTCSGPGADKCASCDETKEGWVLNRVEFKCVCNKFYLETKNLDQPCQECYMYGTKCHAACPSGTKSNNKFMTCETEPTKDLENDDDIVYIITTVLLIVLIIILTFLLYYYFSSLFKKIFLQQKDAFQPLCEEEKLFLANQQEIEKKRRIEEEEAVRRAKIEEEQRAEEEERQRREREEEAMRQAEMEAERRRQEELERKRKIEEEELRRQAELEAIRQMEEEAERKRIQEEEERERRRQQEEQERREREERERIEAEERAERERREAEERAERERREAMEREKQRLRELARAAREQRKMERQMTRQSTMAANEAKLAEMRRQREILQRERDAADSEQRQNLEEAERLNGEFAQIEERIKRSQLRKQQTIAIKQQIFQRQATISAAKQELDSELEGLDFGAALKAINEISQEDIVFLQNLRTPPERIRLCLEAVVMVLKNSTKAGSWEDIRKEISNINFRKSLMSFDPESLSDKMYKKISKEYTNNPQWNLNKIQKASPAAGAFANWLNAIVKFKAIKVENQDLFDKIKDISKEEKAMQEDLDKVDELEEEEKQAEQEEQDLERQNEQFQEKQKTLQKQATFKMEIVQEREEQLKKFNTNDVSLEEIAESEEEEDEDSDDDIDPEILNNL